MTFLKKVIHFCNENVVIIAGLSIIISTHWGWWQLQQTRLVPEDKRKELPIILAARAIKERALEKINEFSDKPTVETDKAP